MLKGAAIDFSPLTAWGVLGGSGEYLSGFQSLIEISYFIILLAMDVINRLIAASCWQNIHAVPQHGAVFGIRVVDGYGAAC
ncbi:hypothetical protein D5086_030067 [Populus alba]|uniref:Uncharacterized protein n=1 Tax=Populus alba TaxID=43335 RepID=A0ACC4AML2_POPAL